MIVTRWIPVPDWRYTDRSRAPVTGRDVQDTLSEILGLTSADSQLVVADHRISLEVDDADRSLSLRLSTSTVADDYGAFCAAMKALDAAHARLRLATIDAQTPDWGLPPSNPRARPGDRFSRGTSSWVSDPFALRQIAGSELMRELRLYMGHELRLARSSALPDAGELSSELAALLGGEGAGEVALIVGDQEIVLSEPPGSSSHFERRVRMLFERVVAPSAAAGPPDEAPPLQAAVVAGPARQADGLAAVHDPSFARVARLAADHEQPLHWVVVDDVDDERCELAISPWPHLTGDGMLRFAADEEAHVVSDVNTDAFWQLVRAARASSAEPSAAPEVVDRPLRVGDTFAAVVELQRSSDSAPAGGARTPVDFPHGAEGLADVTNDARRFAKIQSALASAPPLAAEQVAEVPRREEDAPPG